eukprot:GCRY01005434.1.p1 GENE.GCRY01005434.1~~GCRY01005434.1.p1  ORF type:complete len:153 (-),score=27.68 GCRY01005434.1:2-460(-)
MKLHCLGRSGSTESFLLEFNDYRVLLDAPLDLSCLLLFSPLIFHNEKQLRSSSFHKPQPSKMHTLHPDPIIPLPTGSLFHLPPRFATPLWAHLDWEHIDAVLITNVFAALALPYITEHTPFKGLVFASRPVVDFGKLYCTELVTSLQEWPFL